MVVDTTNGQTNYAMKLAKALSGQKLRRRIGFGSPVLPPPVLSDDEGGDIPGHFLALFHRLGVILLPVGLGLVERGLYIINL